MKNVLQELIQYYWNNYPSLRDENQSLDNRQFHNKFGLVVKSPWEWIPSVEKLWEGKSAPESTIMIYPNSTVYSNLYNVFLTKTEKNITYISWQEIYWAINTSSKDVRSMQNIKKMIMESDLVLVCCASQVDEDVIENIKTFTNGCLICLN